MASLLVFVSSFRHLVLRCERRRGGSTSRECACEMRTSRATPPTRRSSSERTNFNVHYVSSTFLYIMDKQNHRNSDIFGSLVRTYTITHDHVKVNEVSDCVLCVPVCPLPLGMRALPHSNINDPPHTPLSSRQSRKACGLGASWHTRRPWP
jgi:hypothetical protein